MMMKSLLLSLAVVLFAICQLSEAAIPCKQQTGCMCKTDNFTIDISNAFDYPYVVCVCVCEFVYVLCFVTSIIQVDIVLAFVAIFIVFLCNQ